MQDFIGVAVLVLLAVTVLLFLAVVGLGLVIIGERQVGIVVKKFSGRALEPGHLIALNGEAG